MSRPADGFSLPVRIPTGKYAIHQSLGLSHAQWGCVCVGSQYLCTVGHRKEEMK